jgi:hypothetical protein
MLNLVYPERNIVFLYTRQLKLTLYTLYTKLLILYIVIRPVISICIYLINNLIKPVQSYSHYFHILSSLCR